MKKLSLLFLLLSALFIVSCDDNETVKEVQYPIVGTWKPIAVIETTVPHNDLGVSDETLYSACQQESRWVFKEDKTGQRTDKDEVTGPGICDVVESRSLVYFYNPSDEYFEVKYQGDIFPTKGKVTLLTANKMNIKTESIVDSTYRSVTTSFVRVN